MMPTDLRAALHAAIDQVLDSYVGPLSMETTPPRGGLGGRAADDVRAAEDQGPFPYRWPDGKDEPFTRGRWYEVVGGEVSHRALVAWTNRPAWGRNRDRAVVFGEAGTSLYPWTEFVQADHGLFAAGIPDPSHPRALLKDGAQLPGRFTGAAVERTDALFSAVKDGPSLRLVLDAHDEVEMVRHGLWVAGLRNRI